MTKTVKRIPRRKPSRAAEERVYNARVKVWLTEPGNHWCAVMEGKYVRATQCHHRAGRDGEFLLMEKFWLPVSDEGHRWIEDNREEAKARGWLLNRSHKALEAQGLL